MQVWTKDMRFECQRCGKCCQLEDGFVDICVQEWTEGLYRYFPAIFKIESTGMAFSYILGLLVKNRQFQSARCPYLTKPNHCDIYNSRPLTCRQYPFFVADPKQFFPGDPRPVEIVYHPECPGIGKGAKMYDRKGRPTARMQKIMNDSFEYIRQLKEATRLLMPLYEAGLFEKLTNMEGYTITQPRILSALNSNKIDNSLRTRTLPLFLSKVSPALIRAVSLDEYCERRLRKG